MGSTGDPPVPSGHWPDGKGRTQLLNTYANKSADTHFIPSGGSPPGTGQWPVLPIELAAATSEFGLNGEPRTGRAVAGEGGKHSKTFHRQDARRQTPDAAFHKEDCPCPRNPVFSR